MSYSFYSGVSFEKSTFLSPENIYFIALIVLSSWEGGGKFLLAIIAALFCCIISICFFYFSYCSSNCLALLLTNHLESPIIYSKGISYETTLASASSFLFSSCFLLDYWFNLCIFLIFSISYRSTTKHRSSVWSSLMHSLQKTVKWFEQ